MKPVEISNWFQLVSTGFNWFQLVSIGIENFQLKPIAELENIVMGTHFQFKPIRSATGTSKIIFPVTQLVPVRSHFQLPNWFQLEVQLETVR